MIGGCTALDSLLLALHNTVPSRSDLSSLIALSPVRLHQNAPSGQAKPFRTSARAVL
jgi:hypothetical protein